MKGRTSHLAAPGLKLIDWIPVSGRKVEVMLSLGKVL